MWFFRFFFQGFLGFPKMWFFRFFRFAHDPFGCFAIFAGFS